jgi:Peptidase_C39 like family
MKRANTIMNSRNPYEKRRNRKKRLIQKIKRTLWTLSAIILAFASGYLFGTKKVDETTNSFDPVTEQEKEQYTSVQVAKDIVNAKNEDLIVSAPIDYSQTEVIQKLNSFVDDERYETILNNLDIYPDALLKNLVNNPEMLSFVADYPNLSANPPKGILKQVELEEKCPLFLQWDERWGATSYGDESNIAVSGCGPTALSMVIVGLKHNQEATPDSIANFAMDSGYYMAGTGTKWTLMTEGAAKYGIDSQPLESEKDIMENSLDEGAFLICSMSKGDFTTSGHFIVIYDYDKEGFKINDPFCLYRSKQVWTYDQLKDQIKSIWELKNNNKA